MRGWQVEETPEGVLTSGREVYLAVGRAACHGLNAEGTDVGPALPGHSAEQVRQQVRSPLAQMPAYSQTQLSDEELELLVQYIASLEPSEEHVEPVKLSDVVATRAPV